MERQLVRVEQAIGARKHDTSITEDNKAIGPITLVRRKVAEETLTSKLVELVFVVIDDLQSYDPDGCLRKNTVKHEPRDSWVECINPRVDDLGKYVGPNDFPILDHPLWLKFYSPVQRVNPTKPIPRALLESMKALSLPKKKREIFWVYREEVNQLRTSLGNAHLDEHFEQEWSKVNKSDDETGDSSSHGDSSLEMAPQQEVGIISTEGQEPKLEIPPSLDSATHRPYSQSSKRRSKKQSFEDPPKKKPYLSGLEKIAPNTSMAALIDLQSLQPSTNQVHPFFPSSHSLDVLATALTPIMQTSVPIALTLALAGMTINPQDVLAQTSAPLSAGTPIPTTFQSPTSEAVPVSHRLGFEEFCPQSMATVSASSFPLVSSPFVLLFSLLAVTHPVQSSFAAHFLHFPFANLPGAVFVGQAIDHLDSFQQQVVYDRIVGLNKANKRKEKEGAHPCLQTHFSEQRDCLYFANLVPKVDKLESQMMPDDYELQAMGVSLQSAMASDKVGMMEETSKAASTNFIEKSHHLEKLEAKNALLHDSLSQ